MRWRTRCSAWQGAGRKRMPPWQWQRWAQGARPAGFDADQAQTLAPGCIAPPTCKGAVGCAASPAVSERTRVKLRGAHQPPIRLQRQRPGGWQRTSAGLSGKTPGSIRGERTSAALARSASAPMARSASAPMAGSRGWERTRAATDVQTSPGIRSRSVRHTCRAPEPRPTNAARAACY